MNIELKCKNCDKKYLRESALDKHKILCIKDNIDNISLREIVLELVKQNNKLNKDIDELKKWVKTKKKKIVIVDWLNENCKPDITFKTFIETINIGRNELDIIFESNIITGIETIIKNSIERLNRENRLIPLKSFNQKDNMIYIFNGETWELLVNTEFDCIISKLYKMILTEFTNWQTINETKIYSDDFSDIYLKNVKKILGGNNSIEQQKSKIHRNLYKILKMDLQNIIEYEFC